MMHFCPRCGVALQPRPVKGEGLIPYCSTCRKWYFPPFSTAVSLILRDPAEEKLLLIRQYGKPEYILVAGYVSKGESAEQTVLRELREEIGVGAQDVRFLKSAYFPPSETLMLNFTCRTESSDLSGVSAEEVDEARWFSPEEAQRVIKPDSLARAFLLNFLQTEDFGRKKPFLEP